MQANVVIGLIISIFGLSLILFKRFWRGLVKGGGNFYAGYTNFWLKLIHLNKAIKVKGVDEKKASDKGLNVIGLFFMIFGLIIIFLPYIYKLF